MKTVIRTEKLTKRFGALTAVDGIDLDVREGEVFGFLGPNGAGKTTTLRLLCALIAPTSGTAEIAGFRLGREDAKIRAAVGILTEQPGLYERQSAWDNLVFYATLYGLSASVAKSQAERYLRLMGLWDRRTDSVVTFSRGMKQKMAIARSAMHEPRVLFLDEPTTGLDPQSRRAIWDLLGEMKETDPELAIVLTTHAMDEADFLCDRVAIMDAGKILEEGEPERLKRKLATGERVVIETDEPIDDELRELILGMGGSNWRIPVPGHAEFQCRPGEGVGRRAAQLVEEHGYAIRHFTVAPVTLEDVFFSYTGRGLRE
jgi:ABC-2 type transport system ATP-binding protein